MRSTTLVFALAATASSAVAQSSLTSVLGGLSTSCQQTILNLVTTSDLSSCLHISQVIPLVTPYVQNTSSTASLIPVLDQIVAIECGSSGCSNATLTSAVNTITSGCATDLKQYGISNSTVKTIVSQYPLAREITCLKTSAPFNGTAPIPINSTAYNSTNGTFCSTSLLTDLSSKFNQNISVAFLEQLYQAYENGSISSYGKYFNASDLCQDCIFATADLVGVAYPQVGNITLGQLLGGASSASTMNTSGPAAPGTATAPAPPAATGSSTSAYSNITIAQALDGTCMAQGFMWTSNGTLPSTIYLSAVNSTFGYALQAGNQTYPAPSQATPIRRNVAAVKGRWIGQI